MKIWSLSGVSIGTNSSRSSVGFRVQYYWSSNFSGSGAFSIALKLPLCFDGNNYWSTMR